jgi:DNA-binding NarL/FixJ family response regulator
VRVVLAEDQALLRDGLIRLLTAYGIEVSAAVETGPGLLNALLEHRPDAAVVDVRLPPRFTNEGLAAAIEARLGVSEKAVSKHINNIFAKLDLLPAEDDHRRVLAVLRYLDV